MEDDDSAFAKGLGLDLDTLRTDSLLELPSTDGYFTPVRSTPGRKGKPARKGATFPTVGTPTGGATPVSTISLASPTLPPITQSQRRGLVSVAHSPALPRTSSAGGGDASAPRGKAGPSTAWADVLGSPQGKTAKIAPTASVDTAGSTSLSLGHPGEEEPESDTDEEAGDGFILTPELRLKVIQGEVLPIHIQPQEEPVQRGGKPSLSAGAPLARTAPAPTLVHHVHDEPLSLTMNKATTEEGGVDLDRLYYASDTTMHVKVQPKAFRSEYKFFDDEEFKSAREPVSRLALTRAAKAQKEAEERALEARYTKSRPMLADIQHQFPSMGEARTPAGRQPVETTVQSRFADRPILKSVHFRFPGGAGAPEGDPRKPTHLEMQEWVEDRRTWEEVEGAGTLPSWAPHVGDAGEDLDATGGGTPPSFHRVSKMGHYGRAIGAAGSGDEVRDVRGVARLPRGRDAAGVFSPVSTKSPGKSKARGKAKRRRRKARRRRRHDSDDSDDGKLVSGRRPRRPYDKPWQMGLVEEANDEEERAAVDIQRLFRGWRVRLEMMELMRPAVIVQHAFRDLINFRVWRFAVFTVAANRIIRTQRRRWGERAARKARALQWARDIKAANDLQRCYRGYLGRLLAKDLRMKRANRIATIIQSAVRKWFATKRVVKRLLRRLRRGEIRTRAAIYIQTAYRRYKTETMIAWWHWAAGIIQAQWRVYVARRNWYALQIQRVWRSHYAWVWVKQWCAMKITRVARGALARIAVRKEKIRLQKEEDDRFGLENHVVDVAGDVGRKEMEKYLESGRGVEEIQAGAVLLQNKSRMLATQRKEASWQAQLRDSFTLFDVDQRGALDETQLGDLLKEMCVPVDPYELHAAVVDMDTDGNGLIELDEFTQFFATLDMTGVEDEIDDDGELKEGDEVDEEEMNAARGRSKMRKKMRLLKWQMKTQQWVNEVFLTVYKKLAARAMVAKASDDARRAARVNFRRKFPPRYYCTKCVRTFIFDSQLRLHWHDDCDPKDIHS